MATKVAYDQAFGDAYNIKDLAKHIKNGYVNAYNNGIAQHIGAIQSAYTCLEIDFDLYTVECYRQFKKSDIKSFCVDVLNKITDLISFEVENELFDDREFKTSITIKYKPTLRIVDEDTNDELYKLNYVEKEKCYKDGFHVCYGIKCTREQRHFILSTIVEPMFKRLCKKLKLDLLHEADACDHASIYAPVLLIGSCKRDKKTFYEFEQYEFSQPYNNEGVKHIPYQLRKLDLEPSKAIMQACILDFSEEPIKKITLKFNTTGINGLFDFSEEQRIQKKAQAEKTSCEMSESEQQKLLSDVPRLINFLIETIGYLSKERAGETRQWFHVISLVGSVCKVADLERNTDIYNAVDTWSSMGTGYAGFDDVNNKLNYYIETGKSDITALKTLMFLASRDMSNKSYVKYYNSTFNIIRSDWIIYKEQGPQDFYTRLNDIVDNQIKYKLSDVYNLFISCVRNHDEGFIIQKYEKDFNSICNERKYVIVNADKFKGFLSRIHLNYLQKDSENKLDDEKEKPLSIYDKIEMLEEQLIDIKTVFENSEEYKMMSTEERANKSVIRDARNRIKNNIEQELNTLKKLEKKTKVKKTLEEEGDQDLTANDILQTCLKRNLVKFCYGNKFSFEELPPSILNTCSGFPLSYYTSRVQIKKIGETGAMLNHIKKMLCNGRDDMYEYFIKWIAHMLQKPHELPETAILLYGGEGTGKSIMYEFMSLIIGRTHAYSYPNSVLFLNDFNKPSKHKLLVACQEFNISKTPIKDRATQINQLKDIITNKTAVITGKCENSEVYEKFSRILLFSNDPIGLELNASDRRFLILQTNKELLKMGDKARVAHFEKIGDELKDGNIMKAYFNYFISLDISEFNPRVLPKNMVDKSRMIFNNSPLYQFLTGVAFDKVLVLKYKRERLGYHAMLLKDLYKSYLVWYKENFNSDCKLSSKGFKTEIINCEIEITEVNNTTLVGDIIRYEFLKEDLMKYFKCADENALYKIAYNNDITAVDTTD